MELGDCKHGQIYAKMQHKKSVCERGRARYKDNYIQLIMTLH